MQEHTRKRKNAHTPWPTATRTRAHHTRSAPKTLGLLPAWRVNVLGLYLRMGRSWMQSLSQAARSRPPLWSGAGRRNMSGPLCRHSVHQHTHTHNTPPQRRWRRRDARAHTLRALCECECLQAAASQKQQRDAPAQQARRTLPPPSSGADHAISARPPKLQSPAQTAALLLLPTPLPLLLHVPQRAQQWPHHRVRPPPRASPPPAADQRAEQCARMRAFLLLR